MNDPLSVSSIDNKLKIGYESSNKILLNNNQSSIIQSETRENTKISGAFLDNWRKVLEMKKIIDRYIWNNNKFNKIKAWIQIYSRW